MRREEIAFFDVDHTITRRATALGFILVCMKRGYILWWYLLAAPIIYVLYRLFSIKMEYLFRISLPKLTGLSRVEFENIAQEAFDIYIKSSVYVGALQEIESLKKKGVRIILATSAPFEAVFPLAQYCEIPASDIVATQFSYTNGIFDGKLAGVPVFSQFKKRIITKFVERSGVSFSNCSFYSDSVHDVPLLDLVGIPVAANPDYRLRMYAKKRGWIIKDFG